MAADDESDGGRVDETDAACLDENNAVTVPPRIRERLDLDPDERLQWEMTDDGRLVAEVVEQRYGVAEDLEPIDIGEETNAVEETEGFAYEVE